MSKKVPISIAIDGPAGAGKSTVAKLLAKRLGITYVDSGATYRCVALLALRQGVGVKDCPALEALARSAKIEFSDYGSRVHLNGEDVTEAIRKPEVGDAASPSSQCPGVRKVLTQLQRDLASRGGVMEGRDIGSVVLPGATLKVFLDAKNDVRVKRRVGDLAQRGIQAEPQQIATAMERRDKADSGRKEAPLVRLKEAFYIESSDLSAEECCELIEAQLPNTGG